LEKKDDLSKLYFHAEDPSRFFFSRLSGFGRRLNNLRAVDPVGEISLVVIKLFDSGDCSSSREPESERLIARSQARRSDFLFKVAWRVAIEISNRRSRTLGNGVSIRVSRELLRSLLLTDDTFAAAVPAPITPRQDYELRSAPRPWQKEREREIRYKLTFNGAASALRHARADISLLNISWTSKSRDDERPLGSVLPRPA